MDYITKIRENNPLIYNITNEVATNMAANGLIAIGASRAMSNTPKEAVENAQNAAAVILNLGTLTEERAEAMLIAGKAANEEDIPVVLDPIAVGGTEFRTEVIYELLEKVKFTAIRANAGEIAVLGNALEEMKSPDSTIEEIDPEIAKSVAKKYETVVIATGKTDVITDGTRTTLCRNGHAMLQNITASGCLLTSLVGPYVSVGEDPYEASIEVTAAYGVAAELAMEKVEGPGSFIPALLDQLYFLDQHAVNARKRVEEL